MHFLKTLFACVPALALSYSISEAQGFNQKSVPASDIKLTTSYKHATACIISEKPLKNGDKLVLAGLTEDKDCDIAFVHYALYLGDSDSRPKKYLGEETAHPTRFEFASVAISDFGPDFAVIDQNDPETGTRRVRYTFSPDPKDTAKDLRLEYSPRGIDSLHYNAGGLYFVAGSRDDALVGRLALADGKIGQVSILKNRAGTNILKDIIEISNDEKTGFAVVMETGKYIFTGEGWEFSEADREQRVAALPEEIRLDANSTVDTAIFSTMTAATAERPIAPKPDLTAPPKVTAVTDKNITVNWKGESKDYRLPPLSQEAVKKNLQLTDCGPEHSIGPYAVYGDSVIFGIEFYSGENNCGVGGLGFFNPYDGKYDLRYYKEMTPYSTTALFIKGDTAYAGLSSEVEYASSPEGVAVVDLRSGSVNILKIPHKISKFFEHDGLVFSGTDDGITIIHPTGLVSQLKLDVDTEGNCLKSLSTP
jgi:hypothetical protein